MDDTYRKSKGNAGLDGVQFQVSLLTVVLLNACRNHKKWKLSSENQDAGKFDDLILELHDSGTLLLQAKFKSNRKITKQQLLSNNSKTSDFSLAKYFFSFCESMDNFNVETIVICTNANIDLKGLEDVLIGHCIGQHNMLHHEDFSYTFFTLNENILPELKAHAEVYHENNMGDKRANASIINDKNLRTFLGHLQLFFNYPSGEAVLEVIQRLLDRLDYTFLTDKVSSRDVYKQVEGWFKQPKGEYLTEARFKSILCEIRSDKYSETLKNYKVSFQNNFDFTNTKRMYHIATKDGRLIQVLKAYHSLQKCKGRKLYVNSEDGPELLEESINAFALCRYTYLVVLWTQIDDKPWIIRIGEKLKRILQIYQYKKFILIDNSDSEISSHLGLSRDDCEVTHESVTIDDLSKDTTGRVLRLKSVVFQGRRVSLSELLPIGDNAVINEEILEKLLRQEEIEVGASPSSLDEQTYRCYVNRSFSRTVNKASDENQSKERGELHFLDNEQRQGRCPDIGFTRKSSEIWREPKEEIVSEKNIYDVSEKLILIADSAGTGKTTVLTKLATIIKEHYPLLWVIKIEVNDYTEILRSCLRNGKHIGIKDLLSFRTSTKLTNSLEKNVFGTSQKVVLLLDGIDEISPDYTELILSLLERCQEESNFAKIFVTTRSHMVKDLEAVLKVHPFILHPFTEQNQVDFLISYWTHNLLLNNDASREKCKTYAKALVKNISWTYLENNEENHFASIPLHLRMTAEIFQENTSSNDWAGCKEYVIGDEAEPKLRERMNITELYELFIKKKRDIFIDKGNPTGNSTANQALKDQFDDCLAYHRILALEVILGDDKYRYFSNYQLGDGNKEINLLKIGIVQKLSDSFSFIHRTFADYFVAEVLYKELQQNKTLVFQKFLVDTILLRPQYNITRIFLDSFLLKVVDNLSSHIFEIYQSVDQENSSEFFALQSKLIHILAGDGCLAILRLVLKCVHFIVVTDKELNIADFDGRDNASSNTLNVLQRLTQQAGLNIKDDQGLTPLHYAVYRDHLEMVKFLVERGADINNATKGNSVLCYAVRYGTLGTVQYLVNTGVDVTVRDCNDRTVLHVAARYGQLETLKFFVEYGLDINTKDKQGSNLLHSACGYGDLEMLKYLLGLGLDCHARDFNDVTPLQAAVSNGRLNIVEFLVEYGLDFNDSGCKTTTILHLASLNGHLEIVKYLLKLGIDPSIKDNEGFTALQAAVYYGQLETVKFLVGYGLDFNVTNNSGSTLLHSAAVDGHLETVKYLLQLGLDPNVKESQGYTVVHIAAYYGHLDIVKFLVKYGSDLNATSNNGSTLLHSASAKGYLEIVKYLLELVDSTIKESEGFTALHEAAFGGYLDIVRLFVEYGVDCSITNNRGSTPLHLASEGGNLEIIKFLLELDIDPSVKENNGFTALQIAVHYGYLDIVKFFVEYGLDISVTNINKTTLLQSASVGGHLELVKYLLEIGVDANTKENQGFTALHVATYVGQLDIVKYLIEYGLDFCVANSNGSTLLHSASGKGHLEVVKYLLELDFDLDIEDNDGFTALHEAVHCGQLDIVKLLVGFGFDFDVTNNDDYTLLHSASVCGNLETVKYLIELGIDVNAREKDGFTALQTAARYGHLDIVKFFVEYGLDFNVTNNYGSTLLYSASSHGHLELVKYLLELGVDCNARQFDGFTILQGAVRYGHLDVAKYLVEYGLDVNVTERSGSTLLHCASVSGDVETVKFVLELGVDFNLRDNNDFTALQLAVLCDELDVVEFLVAYGLDYNVISKRGYTLLHSACEANSLNTLKFLLGLGIDVDITDSDGFTALQTAAYFGSLDIVKTFVEQGLNYKVTNNYGRGLLHSASEFGHTDTIKFLLELDVDYSLADHDGYTALHLASQYGQLDTVELLVERGLDVNATSSYGYTPLHLACENGHLDTVKRLLELGADTDVRDGDGFAVLQTAVYFGQLEVVKFLAECGLDFSVACNRGHTVLLSACSSRNPEMVKFLLGLKGGVIKKKRTLDNPGKVTIA